MKIIINKVCLLLILLLVLINVTIVIYLNINHKSNNDDVVTGVKYIEKLLLSEEVLKNGLVQVEDNINNKIINTGIRYVGSKPKNKVYFNCKNEDLNNIKYGDNNYNYANSCEVWRIVGIFEVQSEIGGVLQKRIKIIRDGFGLNMSWDSSKSEVNNGSGINQWGKTADYEGADIMRILNGYYIGNDDNCTYCNESSSEVCSVSCKNSINQLSNISLNMIDDSVWYTGMIPLIRKGLSSQILYESERSQTIDEKFLNDNVFRTVEWVGKIGLIYPSDYVYASGDLKCKDNVYGSKSYCKNDNWLSPNNGSYRTISPVMYDPSEIWTVGKNESLYDIPASYTYDIRPSLYLSSDVQIIDGDGDTEPYKLAI